MKVSVGFLCGMFAGAFLGWIAGLIAAEQFRVSVANTPLSFIQFLGVLFGSTVGGLGGAINGATAAIVDALEAYHRARPAIGSRPEA